MAIIKQYHKDTDTTYVYESTYYYDKDKKQSRSKRRVIGKIDKETGEIVPTGKRGRKKKTPAADNSSLIPSAEGYEDEIASLRKKVEEQDAECAMLRARIDMLEQEYRKLQSERDDAAKKLEEYSGKCADAIRGAMQSLHDALKGLGDA